MQRVWRILATVAHLAVVVALGIGDYVTGPLVTFTLVYVVPIVTSAYWWGRWPALVTAIAAAGAWFVNSEIFGAARLPAQIAAWNLLSRLGIYVLIALVVDRIRRDQIELRRLNQLREHFLATVAHELRQPAAALSLATASLAEAQAIGADERRLLLELQRQARDLSRLAGQLLSIGRIESGNLQLNFVDVDLRELARSAVAEAPQPERCDLALAERAVVVRADPERLRQAIDNVLANALKYSPAPERVSVAVSAKNGSARVEVHDRGIGLTADELPLLFRKYGRVPRPEAARVEGVGLGLYLAQMLVRAHGGTVAASSPGRGAGATFALTVPLASRGASDR